MPPGGSTEASTDPWRLRRKAQPNLDSDLRPANWPPGLYLACSVVSGRDDSHRCDDRDCRLDYPCAWAVGLSATGLYTFRWRKRLGRRCPRGLLFNIVNPPALAWPERRAKWRGPCRAPRHVARGSAGRRRLMPPRRANDKVSAVQVLARGRSEYRRRSRIGTRVRVCWRSGSGGCCRVRPSTGPFWRWRL